MQQDVIVMVKRVTAFLVVLLAAALPVRAQTGASDESEADIRYVLPEEQAGQSMATVAVEDRPLAHTEQFMALEAGGRILAPGEASAQAEKVLEKIGRALGAVGAGMESVLKLNVYAASNATAGEVRSYFAERYGGTEEKPAVSYVVTALPHPKALVAMDAVAAVPAGSEASRAEEQRTVRRVEGLRMSGGGPERGHVAVMPGGGEQDLRLRSGGQGQARSCHAHVAGAHARPLGVPGLERRRRGAGEGLRRQHSECYTARSENS
jgi:enamine deaminase RidA (YjgF/YER057c/UK114 family)